MPVHDWTRVDAGLFHDFHQTWIGAFRTALNSEVLRGEYFALVEQCICDPIPDFLTLDLSPENVEPHQDTGGQVIAMTPPRARIVRKHEADLYTGRSNRIVVRHRDGDAVAVIEIISPGKKASRVEFRNLVKKSVDLIRQGVHFLLIDLFPPGPRDPQGVAQAIWDQFVEEDLSLPPDKPLAVAAFDAGPIQVAYVDPIAVGEVLPDMPLFLKPEVYVPAPLEATYQTTWEGLPKPLKSLLQ